MRDFVPLMIVATAVALFAAVAPVLDVNTITEWLRIWQIVLFAVGFVIFVMSLPRMFAPEVASSVRRFLLGLMVFCMGAAEGAGWRLLWRLSGRDDGVEWMLTNRFAAFLLWLEVVGLALMISGPAIGKTEKEPDGRVSWRRLAITAALCLIVGYLVTVGRPDARALVDYLKPYLETTRAYISPSMG